MCVSIVWCWGVSLPLFSVEESKDVLAGHESLLNISQFQVIHWQHVLLLLLLKKGISNKSLAAPGEASVQSAERRLSATQAAHHQGGTGKHSQPRLGTADKFSCYPSVIHTELHASTTQKSLTLTRAPSASLTNTEKPAKELLNAWHCTKSSVFEHRFPMSLTNRPPIPCCSISSGTISTGDMLAPSQRLTGRLLLALFYTTIVGQEGLSMSSLATSSQSYAALTAHCCHLSVSFFLLFLSH